MAAGCGYMVTVPASHHTLVAILTQWEDMSKIVSSQEPIHIVALVKIAIEHVACGFAGVLSREKGLTFKPNQKL
jgi:hypothetical protein